MSGYNGELYPFYARPTLCPFSMIHYTPAQSLQTYLMETRKSLKYNLFYYSVSQYFMKFCNFPDFNIGPTVTASVRPTDMPMLGQRLQAIWVVG